MLLLENIFCRLFRRNAGVVFHGSKTKKEFIVVHWRPKIKDKIQHPGQRIRSNPVGSNRPTKSDRIPIGSDCRIESPGQDLRSEDLMTSQSFPK
jgi:hypothetical protein